MAKRRSAVGTQQRAVSVKMIPLWNIASGGVLPETSLPIADRRQPIAIKK